MKQDGFHYSNILPRKPAIAPRRSEMEKICRRCGATFITHSKVKERCDPCQAEVRRSKQVKYNARTNERKKAARKASTPHEQ